MIMIILIILNQNVGEDRVTAGWQMETEKPTARQITQSFTHHTAWLSSLCCISTETNGLPGQGTATDGTPGMETVLEPEWVGTRGREEALWLVASM